MNSITQGSESTVSNRLKVDKKFKVALIKEMFFLIANGEKETALLILRKIIQP